MKDTTDDELKAELTHRISDHFYFAEMSMLYMGDSSKLLASDLISSASELARNVLHHQTLPLSCVDADEINYRINVLCERIQEHVQTLHNLTAVLLAKSEQDR